MTNKIIAIVDCNNFYVSCERIFQPHLRGRPVVVLSNNDGCAISRSQEAKDLGVKMGEPYFKFKHLIETSNLYACSSNYSLYGDISRRVMQTLRSLVNTIEVYSIDEAFLDLTFLEKDQALSFCRKLKHRVYQWTGIPVSIGIYKIKRLQLMIIYLLSTMKLSIMPLSKLSGKVFTRHPELTLRVLCLYIKIV